MLKIKVKTSVYWILSCIVFCFRDILEGNNWKVQKNEYGELVIPISDSENEEFSDDDNDYYCKGEASEFQGAKSDHVSNESVSYTHLDVYKRQQPTPPHLRFYLFL